MHNLSKLVARLLPKLREYFPVSNLLDNDKIGCAISCVVCLALGVLVSYFHDGCSAKTSSSSTSRNARQFATNLADYCETKFGDVCDLLRERNLALLQLRLDYDRRIAHCFEKHFDDSFSLEDSPYSALPRPDGARFLAIGIRLDINRVKKQIDKESLHPLHPINLIDGGSVNPSDEDLLQSD